MDNAPPTSHRVTEVYKWHKEKRLLLAEPFQRKPVWTLNNKSYLIDTIINGLPIPEIYLQVKTDIEGNTKYIVVDGQQRIRAILEFLDGEYSLLEEDNGEFGGKEFSELPDKIKQDLWNYGLIVRELKTNIESEIRDIFKRLNKNVVPLNRQELRNAIFGGHFLKLMNELAEDDFWAENKIVSPNDIKRMIDTEFISELFIGMIHGVQTKNPEILDKFYGMYDKDFSEKEDMKKRFLRTQLIIDDIFEEDLRPSRWHNKADFYSLFLCLDSLLQEYVIPQEKYPEIKKGVEDFIFDVYHDLGSYETTLTKNYYENVIEHSTNKEQRQKRINLLRQIIIPFLVPKDSRRNFTEEERRIFWYLCTNKECAICKKNVEWKDYELDHKFPFAKGGKTCLENAQITHKICNASKSDKV